MEWPTLAILDDEGVTIATALSGDGQVVAVRVDYPLEDTTTIGVGVWTPEGVDDLEIAGTGLWLTNDGSVLGGIWHTRFEPYLFRGRRYWALAESSPFSWSRRGGVSIVAPALAPLDPADRSNDGRLFAGKRGPEEVFPPNHDLIVWDTEGRVVRALPLPDVVVADPTRYLDLTAMSDDGSVLVGNTRWNSASLASGDARPPEIENIPIRWDETGAHELPPVGGPSECHVRDLSASGEVAVGDCMETGSDTVAVVWTGTDARSLAVPGGASPSAQFVSADGTTVTGRFSDGRGYVPFVWTRQAGVRTLHELAQDAGRPDAFAEGLIHEIRAVSADGGVVAGYTVGLDYRTRPFRLELPSASQ